MTKTEARAILKQLKLDGIMYCRELKINNTVCKTFRNDKTLAIVNSDGSNFYSILYVDGKLYKNLRRHEIIKRLKKLELVE